MSRGSVARLPVSVTAYSWSPKWRPIKCLQTIWRVLDGHRCATNQVLYNVGSRSIEGDLLPRCEQRGIPVIAYSPLGESSFVHDPRL